MLIRNADIDFGNLADVRIVAGVVSDIGKLRDDASDEAVIDAGGCALLPGLNDHHFHLLAFAASLDSVQCGPPAIASEAGLVDALRARQAAFPEAWLRGVGYHPSVAGDIDRHWLDRVVPAGPVRIQHRSGRLWIMNSPALALIGSDGDTAPLEIADGQFTGRLYDGNEWLREKIGTTPPPIGRASRFLLSRGVTGLTDTSPGNGPSEFALFAKAQDTGDLVQDLVVMGGAPLDDVSPRPGLGIGATKIHLRDAELPSPDEISGIAQRSHRAGRPVAIHCTTLAELVVALSGLKGAGAHPGDRIEHAAVVPPELLPVIAQLGLTVVTQPNFIFERGDAYLREVDPADRPWLYRLRGIRAAGIALAGSTDAPFGDADPWAAMQAAVSRRTRAGSVIGGAETLTPEEAFNLFAGALADPGGPARTVAIGASADLCLIDRPWADARRDLAAVTVRKTVKSGRIVWQA